MSLRTLGLVMSICGWQGWQDHQGTTVPCLHHQAMSCVKAARVWLCYYCTEKAPMYLSPSLLLSIMICPEGHCNAPPGSHTLTSSRHHLCCVPLILPCRIAATVLGAYWMSKATTVLWFVVSFSCWFFFCVCVLFVCFFFCFCFCCLFCFCCFVCFVFFFFVEDAKLLTNRH